MQLVKIVRREKDTERDKGVLVENPVWCFFSKYGDSHRTLCHGEAFGFGESAAEYKLKDVKSGGITCHICLQKIKEIKAIRL